MTPLFLLSILSTIGLVNALVLRWQHRRFQQTNQPMFCLIGEDCARVVGSRYGATFGVKNHVLGAVYYAAVLGLIGVAQVAAGLASLALQLIVLAALGAGAFSLYLFYIQAKVLRSWCSWCLIGIAINLLMVVVVVA